MTNIEKHKELMNYLHMLYIQKNHDYGNSFSEQYDKHGLTMCEIRIEDKVKRFNTLAKKDALVKDESIRDTLLDLANYAIMTVMELEKENK